MNYHIVTYGCQMNVHESEKIAGLLRGAGYETGSAIEDADIIVFNTCCIRENAENHAFGNIGALKKLKKQKRGLLIAVGGCMAQEEGKAELLVKTRETRAQKKLSRRERAENLRGSFRAHERAKCRGKSILLVDDVLTTGATAFAVAEALLRAGAARVFLLTAAGVPYAALRGGAGQGDRG